MEKLMESSFVCFYVYEAVVDVDWLVRRYDNFLFWKRNGTGVLDSGCFDYGFHFGADEVESGEVGTGEFYVSWRGHF